MKKSSPTKNTMKAEAPSRTERAEPKLKRKDYEKELQPLQAKLCKLQEWAKYKGLRVIVV